MEYEKKYRRKFLCANCGKIGHEFRMCNEPITSYGLININLLDDINESLILKDKFSILKKKYYKIISKQFPQIECIMTDNIRLNNKWDDIYKLDNDSIPYQGETEIRKFCYYRNKIQFMMVSRRFSLGFIEFIRGNYSVSDTKSIIMLFEQMYDEEILFIQENDYDTILYIFLNRNNETKEIVLNRIYEGKYSSEYCEAKIKFNILLNSSDENIDVPLDLCFYTKHIKPKWKSPEWGFPKGRRDKHTEENMTCACREFEEETGYKNNDYVVLNKIEPIEERLTGTNGIKYKHIYYLSLNNKNENIEISEFDKYEIGEIKWFSYDEAMSNIRPYHIEKKKVLTRVYLFLLNYLIYNIHEFN